MTFYNEKQKNNLIETIFDKAIELDNLFVADNLRMIGYAEYNTIKLIENTGSKYKGSNYAFLASCVAEKMSINRESWQWHTDEVIELITEEYESMNKAVA
jgi:hypothetical protein